MEKKTCCIIGYLAIPADKTDTVRRELEREVKAALEDGYTTFIAEYTEGVGIMTVLCISEQRKQYPHIFLEAVLSKTEQLDRLDRDKVELLGTLNGVKGLCPDCKRDYPLSVTRYMVENASRVITVCADKGDYDTSYAVDYAGTMGREVRNIQLY